MKKQKLDRKLSLGRETLVSLQPDALHDVNGGAARTKTWTCDAPNGPDTQFLCMPPPAGN